MGIPVMASGFRAGSTAQLLTGREPEPSAGGFVGNGNTGGWQLTNLIRASRERRAFGFQRNLKAALPPPGIMLLGCRVEPDHPYFSHCGLYINTELWVLGVKASSPVWPRHGAKEPRQEPKRGGGGSRRLAVFTTGAGEWFNQNLQKTHRDVIF